MKKDRLRIRVLATFVIGSPVVLAGCNFGGASDGSVNAVNGDDDNAPALPEYTLELLCYGSVLDG